MALQLVATAKKKLLQWSELQLESSGSSREEVTVELQLRSSGRGRYSGAAGGGSNSRRSYYSATVAGEQRQG